MKNKSRWTKALSLLISTLICLTILPAVPVRAAEISNVAATADFNAPAAGNNATRFTINTPNGSGVGFRPGTMSAVTDYNIWQVKDGEKWTSISRTNRFQAGNTYRYVAEIGATSSNTLSSSISVTVNGVAWTVGSIADVTTLGITYYFVYSPEYAIKPRYTVTFSKNGVTTASTTANQTIEEGSTATKPADPTDTNYVFDGWYTENTCQNRYEFETPVNSNITLYARWIDKCKVTFSSAHGTAPAQVAIGKGKQLSDPGNLTAKGYRFDGWYLGTNKVTFPYTVYANVTLVAHWTQVYTVSYEFNASQVYGATIDGDLPETETVPSGGKATEPANKPRARGYKFDGWFTSRTGGTKWNFDNFVTTDMTLSAHWSHPQLSYSFNKGEVSDWSNTPAPGKTWYDTAIPSPSVTPIAEGYKFVCWCSDQDATTPFDFSQFVMEDTTLYAQWQDAGTVKVTYDMGNTGTSSITNAPSSYDAIYNSKVTSPSTTPSAIGYFFKGWYSDQGCTQTYTFGNRVTTDTTIYAKWEKAVVITFDLNGGVGTLPDTQYIVAGGKATKPNTPDPIKAGYEFMGWGQQTGVYKFNDQTFANDTTILATWRKMGDRPVTLDLAGKVSPVPTVMVEYNDKVTIPDDLQVPGYEIKGWYADPQYNNAFDFDTRITADSTTIYAKLEKTEFTVKFNLNGEASVTPSVIPDQTVKKGKTATAPDDPYAVDRQFDGWYTDSGCNNAYDFATPVTDDLELFAGWSDVNISYAATQGADGTWIIGSGKDYKITIKRSFSDETCFSHFNQVNVDGTVLAIGTNCTVESGSTVITLKASYLETLKAGTHTIEVYFDDLVDPVQLKFKVAAATDPSPKTSDNRYMAIWIALMVTSVVGLGSVIVYEQKKRFDKK